MAMTKKKISDKTAYAAAEKAEPKKEKARELAKGKAILAKKKGK
jgi:hypothetical protein